MKKKAVTFLTDLLAHIGPSGYEQEVGRFWAAEARTFADEVTSDQHGNIMACVNKGGNPRIMLAGHIDEIGLLVSSIDDKGFLNIVPVGGWDPQILQGQRVWIQTASGRIPGLIGKKPIHKLKSKDRDSVVTIDNMWIDIGARNKKDAESRVRVGDPAVVAYDPQAMPNDQLASRALDDRIGAFVVLEAARLLAARTGPKAPLAEVHAVATVQEEIGLRGAATSAYSIQPDVGIAVDVTFSTDFPSMDTKEGSVKIGKGPVVTRGANINPQLVEIILDVAKKNKIDVQLEAAPRGTGTDANAMQLTRGGVATALISIPCRYLHSPCELISLKDVDAAIQLVAHTCMAITPDTQLKMQL